MFARGLVSRLARPLRRSWSYTARMPTFRVNHQVATQSFSSSSWELMSPEFVRNVAIIAHVDHGKTTLIDELLQASKLVSATEERVMDSNALEQERGITILSKNTSLRWQNPETEQQYQFNIVDTPGHADFGGEVERIMHMVDGCFLLVDAAEGPMAQTRFVLKKALAHGLRPMVIINKCDRGDQRIEEVEIEVLDLFESLGADDEQCDFPILYASAKQGWCVDEMDDIPFLGGGPACTKTDEELRDVGMEAVFRTLEGHVPPPEVDSEESFRMLVSQIEPHDHFGRLLLGRVKSGVLHPGDVVSAVNEDGDVVEETKVLKIFKRRGLSQVEIEEARAGDIVSLAGLDITTVNNTVGLPGGVEPLAAPDVEPPTICMRVGPNDSPLAGEDGKNTAADGVKEWLFKEAQNNVSIMVKECPDASSQVELYGRGELQLGVVLENMRRADYEMSVSSPQVVMKTDEDTGELMEPEEELTVNLPVEYEGSLLDKMNNRRAMMMEREAEEGGDDRVMLVFNGPTRAFIGLEAELKNETSGTAVVQREVQGYIPYTGDLDRQTRGSLISLANGTTTAYTLASLEGKGTLFVGPGTQVYDGMVIGETKAGGNLEVNPTRAKKLTNMRAAGSDESVRLRPIIERGIEEYLTAIREDEVLEITPKHVRLRKKLLSQAERAAEAKRKKNQRKGKAGRR